MLNDHSPVLRATKFVGQSQGKQEVDKGFNQKEQKRVSWDERSAVRRNGADVERRSMSSRKANSTYSCRRPSARKDSISAKWILWSSMTCRSSPSSW